MAKLTPDRVRYENNVMICEKIMPDNTRSSRYIASWVPSGGKMKPEYYMEPIGITIHNTNDLTNVHEDSEQYVRATYQENMGGAIVHYYVDDVNAWQLLRENESGWHASDGQGNGNRKTISIECIMDGTGSKEDLAARDNAARLIAAIMRRYGWTINNLYTHNHWMGLPDKIVYGASKNCPYYLLPNYEDFKKLIDKYLKSLGGNAIVEDSSKEESKYLSYNDIKVGDILNFKGSLQYTSSYSSAKSAKANKDTRVKVTLKSTKNSSHPIHVRSINELNEYKPGIYGWVDISDLEPSKSLPVLVKITSDKLNIRKGPGVLYSITGVIEDKGIYTIVEEKNGWGLLKAYRTEKNGWINLSHTKKCI